MLRPYSSSALALTASKRKLSPAVIANLEIGRFD
jgi:hypothetical protein